MSFVDRVLEDLKEGRTQRAFPHKPVGWLSALGEESLYSENYDDNYVFRQDETWYIRIEYDMLFLAFRTTKLYRGNIEIPLTRAERKQLYKMYSMAMVAEQKKYEGLVADAQL